MKEYNQVDVLALEDVYLKLKVWDDKHPNVDVYNDNEYSGCTSCGSRNISEKNIPTPMLDCINNISVRIVVSGCVADTH